MRERVRIRHVCLAAALCVAVLSIASLGGAVRQQRASADSPSGSAGSPAIPTRVAPVGVSRSPYGYTLEFSGLIQEMDEHYWRVSGRVVLVTESTHVQGTPQVDALAEVKGTRLFHDVVLAKYIKVTRPIPYDPVEFEGVLESLRESTWVVGGVTVTISPITVIRGTPALGLVAEVQGVLQSDGSVGAEQVIIRGPSPALQIDVAGLVEDIEATRWVVGGTMLYIDDQTLIDDTRAAAEVGMWAEVRAVRRQDASLLASRIRLLRPS